MSVALVILGGAAVGAFVAAVAKSSSSGSSSGGGKSRGGGGPQPPTELPASVVPPKLAGAPFAEGIARPLWPVRTGHQRRGVVSYRGTDGKVRGNWARRFAAPRGGGRPRRHAGIDLYAHAGDQVLAIANGTISAVQSFHLGSWAVFVDHGPVTVMYGEVDKNSWRRLGLAVGSPVKAGEPIAEVACMVRDAAGRCTSHMLHLEAYVPGTVENHPWYVDRSVPEALRDPSLLLLLAAQEPVTPHGVA